MGWDGRMDGWMDGWRDGRTDGWMDAWMDMFLFFLVCECVCVRVSVFACLLFVVCVCLVFVVHMQTYMNVSRLLHVCTPFSRQAQPSSAFAILTQAGTVLGFVLWALRLVDWMVALEVVRPLWSLHIRRLRYCRSCCGCYLHSYNCIDMRQRKHASNL